MSRELVALITGYTGETGEALLKELLRSNQFTKIILVGRRRVNYADEYAKRTVV